MGAGAGDLLPEFLGSAVYADLRDERRRRIAAQWIAARREGGERLLRVHGTRVLPRAAGGRARSLSVVRQPGVTRKAARCGPLNNSDANDANRSLSARGRFASFASLLFWTRRSMRFPQRPHHARRYRRA